MYKSHEEREKNLSIGSNDCGCGGSSRTLEEPVSRRRFVGMAAAAAGTAPVLGWGVAQAATPKLKFDTPRLECVEVTRSTIFIKVTAGATGAPAGFSLQWVKHATFPDLTCGAGNQGNLWPPSDTDTRLCKASFSGTPGCSIFNLAANASIIVEVGNLNDSLCGAGLSNCGAEELNCGTEYVFRAFAHANNTRQRSEFTPNLCCTTQVCEVNACVLTQGYWKTHRCDWPAPFSPGENGTADPTECALNNNPNQQCAADTLNTIPIGSNAYTQADLLCSLDQPGQGNALRILAHQLIAAKLNILNGAGQPPAIEAAITLADNLIGSRNILTGSVPTGGPGNTLGPAMVQVAGLLDRYNNGQEGVAHCE